MINGYTPHAAGSGTAAPTGRAGASTAASSTAAKGAVTETVGRWAGTPNAGSSTHD